MRGYLTSIHDCPRGVSGYRRGMKSKPSGSESEPADQGAPTRSKQEIGGKKFRVGAGDTYVPFRSRTRRRRRAAAAAVLGLLVLGAGLYGVVSLVSPPATSTAAAPCPTAKAAGATLPKPDQVTVNVYNASTRNGLAASTAAALKARGFTIGKVTNDPLKSNLTGAAQVRGGKAGTSEMRVVAAEVSGAQLQPDTRTDDSVDLVLGAGFSALTTPEQVTAALRPTAEASAHAGCGGGQ